VRYSKVSLPEELLSTYRKQHYKLAGAHSAVKTCHWTRESLRTGEERFCYKQKFYGIRTLRCLQMTPSLGRCLQRCLFCWRATPSDLGVNWDQLSLGESEAEEPARIVEQCIEAHRTAISGFKGSPRVNPELVELAMNPVHVAISLEGEPTLYPYLDDLIGECLSHGFKTVFLVTNGLQPEVLASLSHEPSQLYVSVVAPDEETYDRVCRPLVPDGWKRLNETLELLGSFRAPTVLRHTLVRGLNLKNPEGYARLIAKANSTYVEPKAAMAVGFYRKRLTYSDMPWHREIRAFAEELARLTGYNIIDESKDSEIVLLSRLKQPKRFE
jgi:tRNA wybutosine-synthesizing protein 1